MVRTAGLGRDPQSAARDPSFLLTKFRRPGSGQLNLSHKIGRVHRQSVPTHSPVSSTSTVEWAGEPAGIGTPLPRMNFTPCPPARPAGNRGIGFSMTLYPSEESRRAPVPSTATDRLAEQARHRKSRSTSPEGWTRHRGLPSCGEASRVSQTSSRVLLPAKASRDLWVTESLGGRLRFERMASDFSAICTERHAHQSLRRCCVAQGSAGPADMSPPGADIFRTGRQRA